ncbi:MAG TPA: cold shock domain-containing protein [Chloroflexota bacterium]|nr:cold shock domain-containing protein [Chloroflexota bacterium]
MAWGTIKNLTTDRGFGYILPEGQAIDGKDLYFNRMDVQDPNLFEQLQAGQRVEYDVGRDKNRGAPKATNVRSIPSS